ncbi:MAG: aroE3 [Actinomycetia bacterium]|nr:aroE3 [Actinomycetes bacterium]
MESSVADLVVNATPVGALGAEPAHPALPRLGPGVLVVDLLYDPPTTDLQRRAREAGATAVGGLGHLLEQAALSFELWTGTPAPLDVMSAAALAVLTDR